MEDKNIYDYDQYVLFDDWSMEVFDKLHHVIYGSTEDEHINIYGEKLMVVDGIVQECSVFDFFTNLLERMGVYGEDGYKTMSEDDASKLICSAKGMEVVTEMFNDFHIKSSDHNDYKCGVLAKDFIKENDERISNDLEVAKYLEVIYGGDRTIGELIAYLSEYVNRNK